MRRDGIAEGDLLLAPVRFCWNLDQGRCLTHWLSLSDVVGAVRAAVIAAVAVVVRAVVVDLALERAGVKLAVVEIAVTATVAFRMKAMEFAVATIVDSMAKTVGINRFK